MTGVVNWSGGMVAGCLLFAPAAGAQTIEEMRAEAAFERQCESHFEAAKTYPFNEETPFVVLLERGSLSHDCKITAFVAANLPTWKDTDRQPIYVIKQSHQRIGSDPDMRFADSVTCGNARESVAFIAAFRLPPIEVPGLEKLPDSFRIVADGSSHIFWSDRLVNGERRLDTGDITIAASNNAAIGELSDRIEELLAGCWQTTEPSLP
jgi:hypothetical protein